MMTDTHPTQPPPADPGMIQSIREALSEAEQWRRDAESDEPIVTARNMESVRDLMALPAKFYPVDAFAEVEDLNVMPIVEGLYDACPELVGSADRVRVTWRVKHGSRNGDVTMGTCGLVSGKIRDLDRAAGRPVHDWEVTLALDVWILLTPPERERLVHHELMHCAIKPGGENSDPKPSIRNHEIEEFGATAARYGLVAHQIRPVALAAAHPETAQAIRTWVPGPDDAPLLGSWATN